jgi:predicted RNase H-like HicB family nuclease
VNTLTIMIELHNGYWAAEVPDNANGFGIYHAKNSWDHLGYYEGEPSLGASRFTELPPGTWEIVCMSKGATPEQAKELIERNGEGWIDYDKDRLHHDIPFPDPVDSFNSLLVSKGCDLNKNYLILKKTA